MNLHVKQLGSGVPLMLIHGWGMHGGIWSSTAAQLAQHFRVYCVDLPGHGYSRGQRTEDRGQKTKPEELLDELVDALSVEFEEPLTLLGWSLGGQIALHWAMREPDKIKRLVLVTSTPCFAERNDWPYGMEKETLGQFAFELEKNHAATLRRFLALQARGSEGERELLAAMRENLFSRGEPDMDSLRGGLEILRDADLRNVLPNIKQPALVIAGERDKLTPPAASHYLAHKLPNARVVEIMGAAHAPFLSHPDEFAKHVVNFMNEQKHG